MNPSLRNCFFAACGALLMLGSGTAPAHDSKSSHLADYSPLVQKVRRATERYRDINVAIAEGWVAATPCVSGPNEGAMGVHFVLGARLGDGVLRADQPEALIYEPLSGGRMRLVGVEFIEIAEVWDAQVGTQPVLEGHLLHLVTGPNRYDLPAFYEIHVWAWENNPQGHFADWNTEVTCNKQPTS